MKLSNERIINDSSKLSEICNKSLPIKASFAIAKNVSKMESILKVYNKEREKLVDKYCEKDENGKVKIDENGQSKLITDQIENWNADIKDLLEIENEIDIHKFSLSQLDGISIQPSELMLIDYMIEE